MDLLYRPANTQEALHRAIQNDFGMERNKHLIRGPILFAMVLLMSAIS